MPDQEVKAFEPAFQSGFDFFVDPLLHRRTDEGRDEFRFEITEKHMNGGGGLHGGMMMNLMQAVLAKSVDQALNGAPHTLASIACDFVSAGRDGDVVEGQATITRKTGSIVFATGSIFVDDRTVMTANSVWTIEREGVAK